MHISIPCQVLIYSQAYEIELNKSRDNLLIQI